MVDSGGETPGPIPNPEAKPTRADGTALGRVWESKLPPTKNFIKTGQFLRTSMFFRNCPFSMSFSFRTLFQVDVFVGRLKESVQDGEAFGGGWCRR